jgi:NTP pyrophosphatase (non-canonical NTP hydrolase)
MNSTHGEEMLNALRDREETLNALRDRALRIAVGHGFTDATIGEDIALMHSELSEALEDHRAGKRPNEVWYLPLIADIQTHYATMYATPDGSPRKPCGIPSELADVIIRVLHFCGKHSIDIEKAVLEKMIYNDSRPMKHGGKVL